MGVSFTHYVIYGVCYDFDIGDRLDEDDYEYLVDHLEDNAYSEVIPDQIVMISDGMDGNYTFIGRVLAKSVDEKGGLIPVTRCDNISERDINEVLLFIEEHKILSKLNTPEDTDCSLGVFVFTHVH